MFGINVLLVGSWSRKKFLKPTLPTGGILADEIGLGKTVEVLACILGNRMPDKQQDLVGIQADKLMEQTTDELVVHCVCGCQEKYLSPGRLWMQCEDCRAWLHQSCVGVTPEKDENFICFRCWTTKVRICKLHQYKALCYINCTNLNGMNKHWYYWVGAPTSLYQIYCALFISVCLLYRLQTIEMRKYSIFRSQLSARQLLSYHQHQ